MMRRLSVYDNQLRDSDSRNAVFQQYDLMKYTNKQLQPLAGYCRNSNYNRDIGRFKAGRSRFDGRALWQHFVRESFKPIPNIETLKQQLLEKFSNENMNLKQFQKVFYSVLENELAPGKYWPQQLINLVDDLLRGDTDDSRFLAHLIARAVWNLSGKVPFLQVQYDQIDKATEVINQTGTENQQFEPQDVIKNLYSINIFNKFFRQQQQEEQQQEEQQQEQQRFLEQQILDRRNLLAELEEELRTKINNITTEMSLARAFKELDRSRNETLKFYFATKKMIFATDSLLETINTSKEAIFNVSAAKSLMVFVTSLIIRYGILALQGDDDGSMGGKVKRLCRDYLIHLLCITELSTETAESVEKKGGALNDVAKTKNFNGTTIDMRGNHYTALYSAGEELKRGKNASACPFTVNPYTKAQKKNKATPRLSLVRADGSDSCFSLAVNNQRYHFDPDVFGGKTGGGSDVSVAVSLEHHQKVEQTALANKRVGRPCVVMGDLNSNKLGVKNGKSYLTNEKSKDFQKYGKDCVVCNRDESDLKCFFLATNGTLTVNFYGFKLTFALKPVKNTFDGLDVPAGTKTDHPKVAVAEVHYVLVQDEVAKRLKAAANKINEFFTKLGG